MSGTRRKARECALQILFAADLVEIPPLTLSEYYWGEFGFEELHTGANKLVEDFVSEIDKIEAALENVKAGAKKLGASIDLPGISKDIKEIVSELGRLREEFGKLIKTFVSKGEILEHRLEESLGEVAAGIGTLARTVREALSKGRQTGQSADKASVKDSLEKARKTAEELVASSVSAVTNLLKELKGSREFGDRLALGALSNLKEVDALIKTRAEHWRIERMAIVDRNILRLAVYEFVHEDTPHTVVINEALEIARRFSTFEATQFINGILDAIKQDLEKGKE